VKINKRTGLLVGGVGTVAALTALTFGGTSALYSSGANGQGNKITSGAMTLTENTPASTALNVTGFMPGDEKISKYALKYVGNDAFVGFDLKVVSTAAKSCAAIAPGDAAVTVADLAGCTDAGTQPMYNGDTLANSGALDLTVTPRNGNTGSPLLLSDAVQSATKCAADASSVVTCTAEVKNVPIPPAYISEPTQRDLIWQDGQVDTVTVTSMLPLAATNVFQSSTVKIDLVARAVQAANNSATRFNGAAADTTFGYGGSGTGTQADLLFPKSWS
jgi:hypothetical protein